MRIGRDTIDALLWALRPHHWSKNLLVFVPLLAAHRLHEPGAWLDATVVFIGFSLCASGVYLFNDWKDREDDARHPAKRRRAIASGHMTTRVALGGAALLPLVAVTATAAMGSRAWPVLVVYVLAATVYTTWAKQRYLVDIVTLTSLYLLRLVGGAVATGVDPSPWLLSLAGSLLLTVALAKRLAEIAEVCRPGTDDRVPGRPYDDSDRNRLFRFGCASTGLATAVLIAYAFSPSADRFYSSAWPLWLLAAMLGYWLLRLISLARRGDLHIDPVVFAASDRLTLALAAASCVVIAWAAR